MSVAAPGIVCRDGRDTDIEAILALLPRLADFDVPTHRRPEDLWQGDAGLLRAWSRGEREDVVVCVASESGSVVGVAAASEREELLTHAPSGHLEALAIDPRVEGRGLGRRLLTEIESRLRARGARGMSLHVFGANARARALYRRAGFDEEIVRCFKPFPRN